MKESFLKYSVAIRTIGKAGDKYIQELQSLHNQTIKPEHIYVHLAHGFERPKEQVGMEEYIDTPKGLVHQRAAANMVEEEYVLIIDDDVYFPEDAVEKMYNALQEYGVDGIAPDTFPTQNMSFLSKLGAYMTNTVKGRRNDGWAIRIQRSGAFSYNSKPEKGAIYPTESAAGTAVFMKTEVWKTIHYEHEVWIDLYPAGTFGEDQLMYQKIVENGFKLLMWYDSGVVHLDANTNKASQKSYDKIYYRAMAQYLTWYRCVYDLPRNKYTDKLKDKLAYGHRFLLSCSVRLLYSILHLSPRFLTAHIKGNLDARRFAKSKEYTSLPPFVLSAENRVL